MRSFDAIARKRGVIIRELIARKANGITSLNMLAKRMSTDGESTADLLAMLIASGGKNPALIHLWLAQKIAIALNVQPYIIWSDLTPIEALVLIAELPRHMQMRLLTRRLARLTRSLPKKKITKKTTRKTVAKRTTKPYWKPRHAGKLMRK